MGHMTAPGVGKAMQDVRLMYAPISNYTCVCVGVCLAIHL